MSNITMDAFEFLNPSCEVVFDVLHPYPGKEDVVIKVCKKNGDAKRFAYVAGEGLARLENSTRAAHEDVLGQLLSVDETKPDTLISFFAENGYLFQIDAAYGEYQSISLEALNGIICRIKATVLLMSELGTPAPNCSRIMALVMYLIMSEEYQVHNAQKQIMYKTCTHDISETIKKASILPPIDGEVDANTRGYFEIKDTIYGSYRLDSDEYTDVIDNFIYSDRYPGITDTNYRDIVYLYRNGCKETETNRQLIDFLFHFMHKVAIPIKWSPDGSMETYAEPNVGGIDEPLREGAIRAARIVLDSEINDNLRGISPHYDIEKLEPSWKTDCLLSALYLSVFFLRPGIEIYRRCANPNCMNSFLVKTTSAKKKYCSQECSNAMAQRFYRRRKMAQK